MNPCSPGSTYKPYTSYVNKNINIMDSLNPVVKKTTAREIKLCGWQLDADGS
jgi:hypothetical protein